MTKAMRAISSSTHPAYRPDIDGMRALAVIGVVIFHAFPSRLPSGFVGVDVFFVISGFLIGSILLKSFEAKKFSFADFYARRVRRIFPALIVVLLSCLVFGYFALQPDEYAELGKHVASGAGFIANFSYWNESGYFDTAAETKPLLHLWSLAIEEQFYLIWPILLWLTWRIRSSFIALTIFVILVSFAINIYQTTAYQPTAFFLLPSRAWELLAGSFLAWLSLKGKLSRISCRPIAGHTSSALGVALIATPMFLVIPQAGFPGWYALAPVLGAVLVIAAGPLAILNKWLLSNRVVVWIGLISFPLYLWHWPLLSLARIIESEVPSIEIRIAAVLASFALATLTFWCVERPLRRWRSGFLVWLLLAIMTVVAAAGCWVHEKAGVEHRSTVTSYEEAKKNCDSLFPDWTSLTDNACRLQKPDGNTLAIVGDSHGGQLFVGLSEAMSVDQGVALFAASCAAPFIDVASGLNDKSARDVRDQAYALINRAYEYVIKSPTITTVLLVHNPRCSYRDATDMSGQISGDFSDVLYNGMLRSVEVLERSGKQAVFVLDNPYLPYDPKQCATRPFRLTPKEDKCEFPRQYFDNNPAFSNYAALVQRVSEAHPNIQILDMAKTLCDEDSCRIANGGELLYADRGHLNWTGSRLVSKDLLEALRNVH